MKKLIALLLAATLIFSFAACGKETETETVPSTTDEFDIFAAELDGNDDDTAKETQAVVVTDVAGNAVTDAAGNEVTDIATEPETEAKPAPVTTAEIIEVYNNAINSAYAAKAGFSKERSTDNEKISGGGVIFSAAKDLIYQFMGVGSSNKYTETVTKGNWESETAKHYLRQSTLTEADVTSATCQEGNGKYLVVIDVKGGSSRGSEGEKYTKAPIDKCGICVGNEDKGYYDHKTGEVIYDALAGTYAGADITESYKNAKISAIIDAETGNIQSLKVEFDIDVKIDIKVTSGTATASTHIVYKDFKY